MEKVMVLGDTENEALKSFAIAKQLREFGFVIVRDTKFNPFYYNKFVNDAEVYFDKFLRLPGTDEFQKQRGFTPQLPFFQGDFDPLLRYFWSVGPATYEELIVIPEGFSDLKETMDTCANKMLATAQEAAEKAATGFLLPEEEDAFTSKMNLGRHVLLLTGIDLEKYGEEGTVIEASHYDHNFLTIHDSSTFSRYNIWSRDGEKIEVDVPRGCFLIIAGKQMEWLTGGDVLACKYEVVVRNKTTSLAIDEAKELGRSLWRASSTLYAHLSPDELMMPIGSFKDDALRAKEYPPIHARDAQLLVKPSPIQ